MSATETAERVDAKQPRYRETHIPRDVSERPLVAFCGFQAKDASISDRPAGKGECASCVVCQEMWDSGVRQVG